MGYIIVGEFHKCGYKFGRWHNMIWMEKIIGEHEGRKAWGTAYGPEDLRRVNAVLFPDGADCLEAYEWTTDWLDVFDDGHEWWGASCWSVYDSRRDRFVVLLASATD